MNSIKGMFYGLSIGDSLGAPHELRNQKKDNYTGKLEIVPIFNNRFSKKSLSIGQYTDDTIMSLALFNSLIKNKGKYERSDVIMNYFDFTRTTSQLGKNTRELLYGVKTIKGYENRFNKKFSDKKISESMLSNGALMRCSPLIFSSKEDIIKDCYITNPNKLCSDVNIIYLQIMKFIIEVKDKNLNKNLIIKFIENLFIENDYDERIKIIFNESKNKIISEEIKESIKGKTKGYVLNALFCAFWALIHFDNYESGIDAIISLQGDTDTNGAITGALLGVYYGFENLNNEENTKYNIDVINNLSFENSDIKLPDHYTFKNIDEKIEKFISYY